MPHKSFDDSQAVLIARVCLEEIHFMLKRARVILNLWKRARISYRRMIAPYHFFSLIIICASRGRTSLNDTTSSLVDSAQEHGGSADVRNPVQIREFVIGG